MTKTGLILAAVCIVHHSGRAPLHALSPRSLMGAGGARDRARRQRMHQKPRNPLGAKASLAPPSSAAESILEELHRSELTFRIVANANGACTLEATSKLGPVSESSTVTGTEEKLLTFASEDRSIELRVRVEQVGKVAFVTDGGRIARFLDEDDALLFSLTLMDKKRAAEKWFDYLVKKHGEEVVA